MTPPSDRGGGGRVHATWGPLFDAATSLSAEDDVLPLHDGDALGGEVAGALEGKVVWTGPAGGRVGDVAVGPGEAGVPVSRGDALHLELVVGNLDKYREIRLMVDRIMV